LLLMAQPGARVGAAARREGEVRGTHRHATAVRLNDRPREALRPRPVGAEATNQPDRRGCPPARPTGALLARTRLEVVPTGLGQVGPLRLLASPHVARFRDYAEKFAMEIPQTTLIRIPEADHIPTENPPGQIARALIDFFTA